MGETIEFGSHLLKMLASFRFDEDPDRADAAKAELGGPGARRTVIKNHECIWQRAGQVKRAALSGAELGVVVIDGTPSDFDPGLAQVRNIAALRSASVKLLLYLEGDDDLAKDERQELEPAQPVQVDERRRIRDGFRHGWIARSPVREPGLPGFLGKR
jgi:hypothetical protein